MLHKMRSLGGLLALSACLASTASFARHEAMQMHAANIENDARMMQQALMNMGQMTVEVQLGQVTGMAYTFRQKAGKWWETNHALKNHFMDLDAAVISAGSALSMLGDMPMVINYWQDLLVNLESLEMLLANLGGWAPGFGNWRNHHGKWGRWGRNPGGVPTPYPPVTPYPPYPPYQP